VLIIVLRQAQRQNTGLRVGEPKGLGIDGLDVSRQVSGGSDLAQFPPPLPSGEEELTREHLVDEGVLVGRRIDHGFEIGDGSGNQVAVEAEDKAAEEERLGAERGDSVGDGAVRFGVGRADGEVHEDSVGHRGVWWRRRRWRKGDGGEGGGEEEGAAGECDGGWEEVRRRRRRDERESHGGSEVVGTASFFNVMAGDGWSTYLDKSR
ncbi:unnamed protein product, partial [Linum tenue]